MEEDSPYDIQILSRTDSNRADFPLLTKAIRETLSRFDAESASVSVAIVGDREIAELNHKYLNHDGPTDVITFDLKDETGHGPQGRSVDGEIVLSAETAGRLAEEKGHPVQAELALYAVHGTLHLLGLDDKKTEDAAKMHQIEDEILTALGLGQVYGT